MVTVVVPQPGKAADCTGLSHSTLVSYGENGSRLALVTPSLHPCEPVSSPSPLPMEIQKLSNVPISIPDVSVARVAKSQSLASTEVSPPSSPRPMRQPPVHPSARVNKFVRRLHDMLQAEQDSGIVEWRRGLLILHSTDTFTKTILPRYFNTKNFKTLRRQLNYYGFTHARSFSTTGSTTTALWVNQDLAQRGTDDISSVFMLKRVEPCEAAKTAEGRRQRKELAISTVEEDIGVSTKSLQLEKIRSIALSEEEENGCFPYDTPSHVPLVVHCHGTHSTKTTIEGAPLSAPVFPNGTCSTDLTARSSLSITDDTESTGSSQCSDAANLLLALSKSSVTCSSL